MELTTERLVLREYTTTDFDAVHDFATNPRTLVFVDWGPNSEQDTLDFLNYCTTTAHAVPRTGYTLAITAAGAVIGSVGLTVHHGTAAEIGYTINPTHWGKGYATEAANALLAFGFSELSLERITATCRPENAASAGVLAKLGMTQTGRLENDRLIRGAWLDSLVFGIDAPKPSPELAPASTCNSQ